MNDVLPESTEDLPRDFGDYMLLRCLGRGGMGKVYLAKIKAKGLVGVDKLCVVKTLRVSHDPEYQRRFVDEARLIVLLTHRNICHVFDAGCFEDQYYLAMEHINGRELRQVQVMAEDTRLALPVDVSIFVVKEVLEALDAAHRMKHPLTSEPLRVVHRDVSPQNVMLSAEGEVKLIDFGLAESTQKLERTAPRIVMGKMAYMSPEQARGETVDGRADQFAAGVLLYELLANERYYGDLPFDDVWRTSGRGGFTPTKLDSIEAGLIEVIKKATAPRRDDRYESCGDMRAVLQQVELKRGALAGSREARTAFQELLNLAGEQMPSASSAEIKAIARAAKPIDPVPPPAVVVAAAQLPERTPPTIVPPARERTRTFRIRSTLGGESEIEDLQPHEKTEIGFVIEGLVPSELPPALTTGDSFRPLSLLSSAPSMTSPREEPKTAPHQQPPREATVVVRTRSTTAGSPSSSSLSTASVPTEVRTVPVVLPAPPVTLDAPQKPKALLLAAAGAFALVAVVVGVIASGGEQAVAVVDAGQPAVRPVQVVVDAGLAALAVAPVVVDAGMPEPVAVVVVDAGVEADPDLADINDPRPVRVKPRRHVPDFPADKIGGAAPLNLVTRTTHLKAFCADVACYVGVTTEQNRSARAGENPEERRKGVRRLQNQCLKACRTVPKP